MSEYRTPQAFRAAFEARQRKRADADGVPFDRVAQVDLYFRLLDRLIQNVDGIVVKGGVALELRLGRARTTRDVDIRAVGNSARILERLRQAGQRDHGDYLAFEFNERAGAETIDGDGVVYEGRRFQVAARLPVSRIGSRSASTWRSGTRWSAHPTASRPQTRYRSPASSHR